MKKKRACFIGNPNVGKSSLFNILTHSNQHIGNWTGKTVENEYSEFVYKDTKWEIVDLPGTYSLIGESEEEKVASNYVFKKNYDVAIVVADATNLERSMEIVLEVLDVTKDVILCLNLMDEAKKRNIIIDVDCLTKKLNIPVIKTSAKQKIGLQELCEQMNHYERLEPLKVQHSQKITNYLNWMTPKILEDDEVGIALRFLTNQKTIENYDFSEQERKTLRFYTHYITRIDIMESYHENVREILADVIIRTKEKEKKEDKILNKLLSNKWTSFPIMLGLLFIILWLTIYFSNIPSDMLFRFFQYLEPKIFALLSFLPDFVIEPLIFGGYRTLYWVVSVMLPPMAIFFPLFSLLEDYGLLPRIAFNLDRPFAKCGSCGKQSLTMCMGLGCNAVGVTGSRIMESKKMRLLSILTNVFMPCNGRFPAIIVMISMFFITDNSMLGSIISSAILTLIIVFGIILTFITTFILNHFILKKEKPMFILELPSFRKPKILRTIYTALKEKAWGVLKRAVVVSFPAGLIIFFLVNIEINNMTLFKVISDTLNPFGLLLGVDGIILISFLLGLPANEIVLPILLLGYSGGNMLVEYESLESLKQILLLNGWTVVTAINFIILCLCHFPCATTLLTIKKETKSTWFTILAFLLPTIVGILLCLLVHFII